MAQAGPHRRFEGGVGTEPDQRAAIDFLSDPATHGVAGLERFETHGNLVFLGGRRAFKTKRAVRFDYMDFSTLERRRVACHREVEVNQRCGGDLYLGCVPVRGPSDGQLTFGGNGDIIEWAVCRSASNPEPPEARAGAKPSGATLRCAPPALAPRRHNLRGGQLFEADWSAPPRVDSVRLRI